MISNDDYGPHIGTSEENFFQSDRDIKRASERKNKQQLFGTHGSPITLPSKVLDLKVIKQGDNLFAFVGLSGYLAQKWDLKVLGLMQSKKVVTTYKGHKGPVTRLLVTADYLFTSSWDKTIKKWDLLV